MDALDGNSIAGTLAAVFDTEMTTATGTCANCGSSGLVGEFAVYLRAPGTVVRCRICDNVLMVFVDVRGMTCVDLAGLRDLSTAST